VKTLIELDTVNADKYNNYLDYLKVQIATSKQKLEVAVKEAKQEEGGNGWVYGVLGGAVVAVIIMIVICKCKGKKEDDK
jgi:hypothetical protein